jgi:glutaredoxin-like protein NrdH
MTVTVYTMPACGGCIATKKHLERAGIPYITGSIDDVRDLAVQLGITAAPVVEVDGELAWGGYRPDRIDALSL